MLTKQLDNCFCDYDYKVTLSFANIFAVFERCALVLLFLSTMTRLYRIFDPVIRVIQVRGKPLLVHVMM